MAYNLKSESEVKDYINNLGIEYRFGCYSEKKPEVCHLLADFLEAIKKDYEKAAKVYRNNCDEYKYGKSCLKYGTYSLLGRGMYISGVKHPDIAANTNVTKSDQFLVPKNMKRAFEYALEGCNLGRIEKNSELSEKYKTRALEIQEDIQNNKTLTFQEGLPP
ncbi:hypothetical protein NQ317_017312 [Molorchus minor]|uniref:Uncharacterized protein n=1 Tax=Molorchus minor TaxID=1323400 RepID=A0ABQ9K158_9CUCU|nr:hypothetical protein NQ317_017312 [Molorchus minor]